MAGVTISLPALPEDESARIRKREPQHNVTCGQKPQDNKGIPEWGMYPVYGMQDSVRPYRAVSLGTGGAVWCVPGVRRRLPSAVGPFPGR